MGTFIISPPGAIFKLFSNHPHGPPSTPIKCEPHICETARDMREHTDRHSQKLLYSIDGWTLQKMESLTIIIYMCHPCIYFVCIILNSAKLFTNVNKDISIVNSLGQPLMCLCSTVFSLWQERLWKVFSGCGIQTFKDHDQRKVNPYVRTKSVLKCKNIIIVVVIIIM